MPTKTTPAETWLFSGAEWSRIEVESDLLQARARRDYHLIAFGPEHHQTKHDQQSVDALEKKLQGIFQPSAK